MIAKMAFGLCGRLVHVGQKWAVLPAPCLAVLKILSLPVLPSAKLEVFVFCRLSLMPTYRLSQVH